MSEAPDIREQGDCPTGDACDWSCDQHEPARERQDEPHPPGGHCGACPFASCSDCAFQPKETSNA